MGTIKVVTGLYVPAHPYEPCMIKNFHSDTILQEIGMLVGCENYVESIRLGPVTMLMDELGSFRRGSNPRITALTIVGADSLFCDEPFEVFGDVVLLGPALNGKWTSVDSDTAAMLSSMLFLTEEHGSVHILIVDGEED